MVFVTTLRPEGAFGVRQLAAAFGFPVSGFPIPVGILYSKTGDAQTGNGESGSKLPHSESLASRKLYGTSPHSRLIFQFLQRP